MKPRSTLQLVILCVTGLFALIFTSITVIFLITGNVSIGVSLWRSTLEVYHGIFDPYLDYMYNIFSSLLPYSGEILTGLGGTGLLAGAGYALNKKRVIGK